VISPIQDVWGGEARAKGPFPQGWVIFD